MINIMLIAPSNAGKGTQADITKEKYGMPHISAGDYLREIATRDTDLGKRVKVITDKNDFVDDILMTEIIKDRITKEDCNNGFILDGYPRTVKQLELYSELLKELNIEFGVAFFLDCPYEVCEQRVTGRLLCSKCKKVYHEINPEMKPKKDGVCDECGAPLIKRAKDNLDILKDKFDKYQVNTKPILDRLDEMGVLYKIDASQGRDYTNQQVEEVLKQGGF